MEKTTYSSASKQPTIASTAQPPLPTRMPVLIVGAGPVGLCASILLARHGIRSLLVERRPIASPFPQASGVVIRSLELLHTWGLKAEVRREGYTIPSRAELSC